MLASPPRAHIALVRDGAPDAERVVVVMGSATGAVREAVEQLAADGEKVGVLQL